MALLPQVFALWCTDTIKRHPVTRMDEEAGEGELAKCEQAAAPPDQRKQRRQGRRQQQAADIEMGLSNGRDLSCKEQAAAGRVDASALD